MITQPNILASYLYLCVGEAMPDPILNEDGELDVAADNAALESWSNGSDSFTIDQFYLRRFIVQTELLLIDLEELELDPNEPAAPQYMRLFYEAAKTVFDNDKTRLRLYFAWLYLVVFQRSEGPRWGEFVQVYGVDEFNRLVRQRFNDLIT